MGDILKMLVKEFSLKEFQVVNTVKLIDEGNTIPFIARYRKEMTGELDDQVLRLLHERLLYLRSLNEKKVDVKRIIEEQGKLTEEITLALEKAETLKAVEDIYRPYKPKRRTRASIAKDKGLEPLAEIILACNRTSGSPDDLARPYINPEKEVNTEEDALNGAMDIIAEVFSDDAALRNKVRDFIYAEGLMVIKALKEEDSVYRMYYDYKEPVSKIASHRILAILRGEKDGYLDVNLDTPHEKIVSILKMMVLKYPASITAPLVENALKDSFERLLLPSVDNEVRNELLEAASEKAIRVFAENLKNLLLQPPVKGRTVMGFDPAYRTGCKLAIVDDTGAVLYTKVIYPTPPQSKVEESADILKKLIDKYNVNIISIGNGTASKESEIFVAGVLKEVDKEVYYMVVNEAGASVYSASKLGAEEFPDFDVSLRSAVSIARRLQDPLAELVKIDPKSIGVGQYQHDMNQKRLGEALGGVVEYCVNSVGVDINTASPSLLSYISGISGNLAKNIVDYRNTNGKYHSRFELKKVKKLGDKTFEQCAGFLRIPGSESILDNTSVHPESYNAAKKLLEVLGYSLEDVKNKRITHLKEKAEAHGFDVLAKLTGIGVPTLRDIIDELLKPGRDPRDELPKPVLMSEVLHIEDLKPDMVLTGTVRNVAAFGAFVDIGVHQDGLVHISQLCEKFVKDPMEVISVGDIVKVRVVSVEPERKRISLSMRDVK